MKPVSLAVKIVSLLFLLGSLLCLILTLIIGSSNSSALGKFYWLETDCSQYSGSPIQGRCRWTSYGLCGVGSDGKNTGCTKSKAAYPFSPKNNFKTTKDVPSAFINNRNKYFYMSRIGWAFSLIGLFFLVCSIIPFIIYIILHKGLKWVFIGFYSAAFIFTAVSMALSTAVYASGKSVFHHDGNSAKIGPRALTTAWISVGCFIVNFFLISYLAAQRDNSYRTPDAYDEYGNERKGFFHRLVHPKEEYPAVAPADEPIMGDRLSYLSQQAEQNNGARFMDSVNVDNDAVAAQPSVEEKQKVSRFKRLFTTPVKAPKSGNELSANASPPPQYASPSADGQYEQQVQNVMKRLEQEKAEAVANT
ncbi:hypothetical protein FOA43_000923 [Brettanomyces nanus]|uniref:Uncharacterized protein n=1 Tax=Eeniella nana TaxID=13502 RepID=A0A875RWH2_EENNA|nr:uncharacterized protein FOA43_000923 [Brettanomyces nanus]QPG73611.1 hypothetical protein FOA43_000923 [Brettanomyces nanus]